MNDDYDCDFMKNQKYHYLAVTDPNVFLGNFYQQSLF